MPESYLSCCPNASLRVVAALYQSSHDDESVAQCRSCGAWWFHRFHEWVVFDGGDEVTSWYTRLTDTEAEAFLRDRAGADRSFLRARPCTQVDARGAMQVDGQPEHAWR